MGEVRPAMRFDGISLKAQFAVSGLSLSQMNVDRFLFVELRFTLFTNPETKRIAIARNASTEGSPYLA